MEPNFQQPTTNSSPAIPLAIVAGFALIAAAIFFSGGQSAPTPATTQTDTAPTVAANTSIRPVDDTDFIRGNPNAPIMLVEYSDYDCPFCKQFHETMKMIMEDYAVGGQVAWVYRQFPISQLHPNAPRISEAAFCVGELGGDEAFWTFSDLVFDERELNEATNMTRLPEFAMTAGVDQAAFTECLNSGRQQQAVTDSYNDALAAGAQGTPHTIVLIGDQQAVINGAQPYSVIKEIIDNLISQIEGGAAARQ